MNVSHTTERNHSSLEQATTLEQALNLLGTDDLKAQEALLPYCWQAREQEDQTLGKRYRSQYNIEPPTNHAKSKAKPKYVPHDFNVEEEVFGAGFHCAQTKELVFLELLNMLACQAHENPFDPKQADSYNTYYLIKIHRTLLRRVLFNNPYVSNINSLSMTNEEKWSEWRKQFIDNNQFNKRTRDKAKEYDSEYLLEEEEEENGFSERNFDNEQLLYLEKIFGDFSSFDKAIKLLRSWAILNDSNKQWPYRYVFPFGIESLFWECAIGLDFQGNYMAGAGQIIFHMLARQFNQAPEEHKENIGKSLVECFFKNADAVNIYAQLISEDLVSQGDAKQRAYENDEIQVLKQLSQSLSLEERLKVASGCTSFVRARYFPYAYLPIFNQLSEDFSNILSLPLNKQERLIILGTVSLLNLMVFLLEQQQKLLLLGQDKAVSAPNIDIVLAIDSNTALKRISRQRLRDNDEWYHKGVKNYCEQRMGLIVQSFAPFLLNKAQLNTQEQELFIKIARAAFAIYSKCEVDFNSNENKLKRNNNELNVNKPLADGKTMSYQDALAFFVDKILGRKVHMDGIVNTFASYIGLTNSANAGQRYYVPSDDLVRCLVLIILGNKSHMMLSDFLESLYQRYHIVIGPAQGQKYFKDKKETASDYLEENRFKNNLQTFTKQLRRLDLAISLSDGFDYVKNPFVNWLNNK